LRSASTSRPSRHTHRKMTEVELPAGWKHIRRDWSIVRIARLHYVGGLVPGRVEMRAIVGESWIARPPILARPAGPPFEAGKRAESRQTSWWSLYRFRAVPGRIGERRSASGYGTMSITRRRHPILPSQCSCYGSSLARTCYSRTPIRSPESIDRGRHLQEAQSLRPQQCRRCRSRKTLPE